MQSLILAPLVDPSQTCLGALRKQSPTFLASGTNFMEDSLAMDIQGEVGDPALHTDCLHPVSQFMERGV